MINEYDLAAKEAALIKKETALKVLYNFLMNQSIWHPEWANKSKEYAELSNEVALLENEIYRTKYPASVNKSVPDVSNYVIVK